MGVITTTGIFAGLTWSTVIMGAATAVGMAAQLSKGSAQQQQGDVSAEIFRRQAAREREIGELNARRVRERGESLAATQRAILGAGGGEQSTGSALLIQEDLSEETEFNARLAEANAEAAAQSKASEAVLARLGGQHARTASFFRAGTALLSGGAKIAKFA
jgi:hypothetical protein